MAKAKVTNKWIKEKYTCIPIEYCDLQHMLYYRSPAYYTRGVYGWNYDAYTLEEIEGYEDCVICTGYRDMPCSVKMSEGSYSLVREYELKAREYLCAGALVDSREVKAYLDALLKELLDRIIIKE